MSDGAMVAAARAVIGTAAAYRVELHTGTHGLIGDEPAPEGGDAGPSPFGFVLSGLGACTAITLRMYAERKAWPLTGVEVDLTYRWVGEGQERRGHIERTLRLNGALDEAQRARILEIAEKTPVTRALKAGISIATTLR